MEEEDLEEGGRVREGPPSCCSRFRTRCGKVVRVCKVLDWTELILYVLVVLQLILMIHAAIQGVSFAVYVSVAGVAGNVVVLGRVRYLAAGEKISAAATRLEYQNAALQSSLDVSRATNASLTAALAESREQVDDLERVVGLVGRERNEIERVKEDLRAMVWQMDAAVQRQEATTVLSMFFGGDRDGSFTVDAREFEALRKYVESVYKIRVDMVTLDENNDGVVDVTEFVKIVGDKMKEQFEQSKKNYRPPAPSRRPATPMPAPIPVPATTTTTTFGTFRTTGTTGATDTTGAKPGQRGCRNQ